jgi:hypothetical protein
VVPKEQIIDLKVLALPLDLVIEEVSWTAWLITALV